jgi:hypothetical protein
MVVLAVMGLVFFVVYSGLLAVGRGSLLGYVLMFMIGGAALHRLVLVQERAEAHPADDPETGV